MEQGTPEAVHPKSIPLRLALGLGNTILNPFRIVGDFVNFDPSPEAMSSLKPGVFSELHKIREELRSQQNVQ